MSRRRNALIAAAFTYAQWILSAFASLFVTRFLIRSLGQDVYGTWLATAALLGYAALADFGVLGVMPWLFAEADGAKDAGRMRSLFAHGLAAAVAGAIGYLLVALCVWSLLPGLLHLAPSDHDALRGPIMLLSLVTAASYPLRLFSALRLGLQDYRFTGAISIGQTLLNVVLVVALTRAGAGLYAVALGVSAPALAGGVAALARTLARTPEILREWPRIGWSSLRPVAVSGVGQWLGALGWQLAFATDGAIIAYLGRRDLVPMFVVTSRLGLTLMQLSWALPDSTSVGLAQLNAEGFAERVSSVVATLMRLHLLAAGLIATSMLAGNFGFVSAWVGRELYGGAGLSALFALNVVVLSLVHSLAVPTAVLGRRVHVGILTLTNGAVHVALALALGRFFGLWGVAAATSLSAILTTIPAGARLLSAQTSLSPRRALLEIVFPWLVRIVPSALLAVLSGWALTRPRVALELGQNGAVIASLAAGAFVGTAYLASMRSLIRDLPFGPRLRRVLVAFRLV